MDYVVGSVAALITGNVTPNRPKLLKRALTPTKHQASPNVTPKSQFVDDRSIFLSPTLQKKKEVAKKSPKRIFENPDLDETSEEAESTSPKADKVKKHLEGDLDAEMANYSPKKGKSKLNKSVDPGTPKKKKVSESEGTHVQTTNESTPKKKKKRLSTSVNEEEKSDKENLANIEQGKTEATSKKSKKKHKSESSVSEQENIQTIVNNDVKPVTPKKKKNKKDTQVETVSTELETAAVTNKTKKNKKRKKNKLASQSEQTITEALPTDEQKSPKKKQKKNIVNPNAITNKDSDSEHESDNEIESENEKANNEILDKTPAQESSDDEEEEEVKKPAKKEKKERPAENNEEESRRTLFIGNVPFSKKCKKEIKKIFSKHGDIETVRIRTIPVKDARMTPKLAVIKNELHPERSTVNVYIKYKDAVAVDKALSENNTVLNDFHLRVSRSSDTGAHDSNRAIFIGNLPFAIEDDQLRAKFEKCGAIDSVRIVRDRKTNAGKGFGYVNFASRDGVELALSMTEEDLTMKNRIIRVKRCTYNAKRPQGASERRDNKTPVKQATEGEGAFRRIMKKRQNQEGGGPPNKRPRNINQPSREKKTRKEFVGMTSEKKKKQKFTKGQKKKRALSEILTKHKTD